jgi:hypothetical protein
MKHSVEHNGIEPQMNGLCMLMRAVLANSGFTAEARKRKVRDMSTPRYIPRMVVGLVFRAVGLVAFTMGGLLLFNWLLLEVTGGSRSYGYWIFAAWGLPCAVFGIICRMIASRLIRASAGR